MGLRLRWPATVMLAGTLSAAPSAHAQTDASPAPRVAGNVELVPGVVEHRGRTYEVDRGRLWVPASRRVTGAPLLELRFVRYRSRAAAPAAPVVFLAGGPGGSGIATMSSRRGEMMLSLLDERDVIGFDQRGTGISEPRGLLVETGVGFPLDAPGDPEAYCEAARAGVAAVVAAMEERGIDLSAFTTEEAADDLEALRRALGVERLVLWGSSYGTHLALATVRRHPDAVDAVILAGTEGPDHTFKLPSNLDANLERLARLVRADPMYRERMPDLVGAVREVMDELDRRPKTVAILPGLEVTVGKWDLQRALSTPMGSRSRLQSLPSRVFAMQHGEFFDLARWAVQNRAPDEVWAMSLGMDCASYATADRLARIEAEAAESILGATIDFPYPCACDAAGLPRLDDEFRAPVVSDVPALFVSGTLDGRTPVSNAEEIARGFANQQHLIVERASHGEDLFTSTPQILEAVRLFLRGERIPHTRIEGPIWTFDPPFARSLEREILDVLATKGYDAGLSLYQDIRSRHEGESVYDFRETVLNDLGYEVMGAGLVDLALDVFRLNTVAYPEAFNTWDSLGEAYMEKGDYDQARRHYAKSLELNPDNVNARQMLELMKE